MNDVSGGVTPEGYADRYFTVRDGLRLHYRDYPGSADRPPLLCLPGLTRKSSGSIFFIGILDSILQSRVARSQ